MKVLRLYNAHDLRLTDESIPVPGPTETLVKVTSVGICGSDVHWYTEGGIGGTFLTEPLVLGHEFAGIVINKNLNDQRVAVDPAIPCKHCKQCLEGNPNLCPSIRFAGTHGVDGSLQEYISWPSENLYPLPGSISDEEAALLEPLGVALHALELGPIMPGIDVGIYGCGPIGLMMVQLARLSGVSRIYATDKLSSRLETAMELGATDVFLANGLEGQDIWQATHQRGVDVAYEMAGDNAAVETAMVTSKYGGKVVIVGITADDRTTFTASTARRKGLTILIARRMRYTYPRAIRLVSEGRIDLKSLITHRFPLDQYDLAFRMAESRSGIKVVIQM